MSNWFDDGKCWFEEGDNITYLKDLPSNLIRLCYMDPPYNTGREYNVVVEGCFSQEKAYQDTWSANSEEWDALKDEVQNPDLSLTCQDAFAYLESIRPVLLRTDKSTFGYCVHIARRLFQIHRVLTRDGTLFFHCDTHACGWINVLLDIIFGRANQQNHLIWKRTWSHSSSKKAVPVHDHLFRYTKTSEFVWNSEHAFHKLTEKYEVDYKWSDPDGRRWKPIPLTGPGKRNGGSGQPWCGLNPTTDCSRHRHWAIPESAVMEYLRIMDTPEEALGEALREFKRMSSQEKLDALDRVGLIIPSKNGGIPEVKQYLDKREGVPMQDVWLDINRVTSSSGENLDFEGQKPIALLERIILLSSKQGDLILDPYAGTGTTAVAAKKHDRRFLCYEWNNQTAAQGKDRIARECGKCWREDNFNPVDIEAVLHQIHRASEAEAPVARLIRHSIQVWAIETALHGYSNGLGRDFGFDGWINLRNFIDRERRECLIEVKTGGVSPKDVSRLKDAIQRRPLAVMGVFLMVGPPTDEMAFSAELAGHISSGADGDTTKYPKIQFLTFDDLFQPHYGGKLRLPGAFVERSDPSLSPEAQRRETELIKRRSEHERGQQMAIVDSLLDGNFFEEG